MNIYIMSCSGTEQNRPLVGTKALKWSSKGQVRTSSPLDRAILEVSVMTERA